MPRLFRRLKMLLAWTTLLVLVVAAWSWASSLNPDVKRAREASGDGAGVIDASARATPEPVRTPASDASVTVSRPATLRLILERYGPETLLIQSAILRCSAGFCSSAFIVALMDTPGIEELWWPSDRGSDDQGLAIRVDALKVTPKVIIAVYERALTKSPDPTYPLPHTVEIISPEQSATFTAATATFTTGLFGPNTLFLQSPDIRCDVSFCAGSLLKALRRTPGVIEVRPRYRDAERQSDWGMAVTYDPSIVGVDGIVAVYIGTLRVRADPEYPLPHEIVVAQHEGTTSR